MKLIQLFHIYKKDKIQSYKKKLKSSSSLGLDLNVWLVSGQVRKKVAFLELKSTSPDDCAGFLFLAL